MMGKFVSYCYVTIEQIIMKKIINTCWLLLLPYTLCAFCNSVSRVASIVTSEGLNHNVVAVCIGLPNISYELQLIAYLKLIKK